MVNVIEVYGSDWLNCMIVKADKMLNKPLTINTAEVVDVGVVNPKRKIVLTFNETTKKLPLNKTNAKIISEIYGEDTDNWIEQKIYLQITKRQFQGNIVDAIEVSIRN